MLWQNNVFVYGFVVLLLTLLVNAFLIWCIKIKAKTELASFLKRLAASVIDMMLLSSIFLLATTAMGQQYQPQHDIMQGWFLIFAYITYHLLSDILMNGSIGKKVMQLEVVDASSLGIAAPKNIIIRNLCRLIPAEFVTYIHPYPRGFHDTLSHTMVIDIIKPQQPNHKTPNWLNNISNSSKNGIIITSYLIILVGFVMAYISTNIPQGIFVLLWVFYWAVAYIIYNLYISSQTNNSAAQNTIKQKAALVIRNIRSQFGQTIKENDSTQSLVLKTIFTTTVAVFVGISTMMVLPPKVQYYFIKDNQKVELSRAAYNTMNVYQRPFVVHTDTYNWEVFWSITLILFLIGALFLFGRKLLHLNKEKQH
jgi:hypothetical protein